MEKFGLDVDVVRGIALIEQLKCGLLSHTADLFQSMSASRPSAAEAADTLAEIIIEAYLLSGKLGTEYEEINRIIRNKLKTGLLDAALPLNKEKSFLYQFMNKER